MSFERPRKHYPGEARIVSAADVLGAGGYGMVYRAKEKSGDPVKGNSPIQKPRIVKRITKSYRKYLHSKGSSYETVVVADSDKKLKKIAERECAAYKDVPHLHVKELIYDQQSGDYYIVMAKMPGQSLREVIDELNKNQRHLSTLQLIRLAIALVTAVQQQVHDNGLRHLDIKPDNLMVDLKDPDHPIVNVIDYGLAKDLHIDDKGKKARGTQGYAAPELLVSDLSQRKSTQKSDVYSLGMTLIELFCQNYQAYSQSRQKLHCRRVFSKLVSELNQLFTNMCHRDPNQRWDLSEALEHLHQIRLKIISEVMSGVHPGYENKLQTAHNAAMRIGEVLAQNTIDQVEKLIRDADFPDEPATIAEFTEALGMRVLRDCSKKQEILDKIASMKADYASQVKALQKIRTDIARFKQTYQQSKLFTKEGLGDALDKYDRIAKRKLDKHANKQYSSLDDVKAAADRMRAAIEQFPHALEVLVEKRCHAIFSTMKKSTMWSIATEKKLLGVMHALQKRDPHADASLERLRRIIRSAISEYMKNTATKDNFEDGARLASHRRIKDMQDMLNIVNYASDKAALRKDLTKRLRDIRTGIFGFSGFFSYHFGRSELRDQVEFALNHAAKP